MPGKPRQSEGSAQRNLATVITVCFVAIASVVYVILRTTGALPDMPTPAGMGTPLAAQPYFAQLPPLASAVNRAESSVHATSKPSVDMSAVKLLQSNRRQQTEVVSVKSYLQALEEVETAKHALLQELVTRFPQLRVGLTRSVEEVIHTPVSTPADTPLSSASVQQGDDLTRQAWDALIGNIEQKAPPYSCIELHTGYLAHLRALKEYVRASLQAEAGAGTEASSGRDPLTGKERAGIQVRAETRVANEALRAVCSRYRMAPEFEITNLPGR